MKPIANANHSPEVVPAADASTSDFSDAAAMIGMPIRNDRRAEPSRARPRQSPAEMVAPEREMPGAMAIA